MNRPSTASGGSASTARSILRRPDTAEAALGSARKSLSFAPLPQVSVSKRLSSTPAGASGGGDDSEDWSGGIIPANSHLLRTRAPKPNLFQSSTNSPQSAKPTLTVIPPSQLSSHSHQQHPNAADFKHASPSMALTVAAAAATSAALPTTPQAHGRSAQAPLTAAQLAKRKRMRAIFKKVVQKLISQWKVTVAFESAMSLVLRGGGRKKKAATNSRDQGLVFQPLFMGHHHHHHPQPHHHTAAAAAVVLAGAAGAGAGGAGGGGGGTNSGAGEEVDSIFDGRRNYRLLGETFQQEEFDRSACALVFV
jgi:hypothetical protein